MSNNKTNNKTMRQTAMYTEASKNLKEKHGLSITADELKIILETLYLRPRRLVGVGLASKPNKAAGGGEETDTFEKVEEGETGGSDSDDSGDLAAPSDGGPVWRLFKEKGLGMEPKQVKKVLRLLHVNPRYLVRVGIAGEKDLKALRRAMGPGRRGGGGVGGGKMRGGCGPFHHGSGPHQRHSQRLAGPHMRGPLPRGVGHGVVPHPHPHIGGCARQQRQRPHTQPDLDVVLAARLQHLSMMEGGVRGRPVHPMHPRRQHPDMMPPGFHHPFIHPPMPARPHHHGGMAHGCHGPRGCGCHAHCGERPMRARACFC